MTDDLKIQLNATKARLLDLEKEKEFTNNQMMYLLGRIDEATEQQKTFEARLKEALGKERIPKSQ